LVYSHKTEDRHKTKYPCGATRENVLRGDWGGVRKKYFGWASKINLRCTQKESGILTPRFARNATRKSEIKEFWRRGNTTRFTTINASGEKRTTPDMRPQKGNKGGEKGQDLARERAKPHHQYYVVYGMGKGIGRD